jgi:hypothetical protein
MMLRSLLKQMQRSRRNLRLARQRKLKKLKLMPTKSMLNENKPWQSVFTPCRLPLKVSAFALSSIFDFCCTVVLVDTCLFFSSLFAFYCVEFTGISPSSLQTDDDPLMTAVNLLEANWISI